MRDAIAAATDGETITIGDSVKNITVSSEIIINKSVTIKGNGETLISGGKNTRVFKIENPKEAVNVKIANLGIVDAKNKADEYGGAVYNNGQTLTLDTVLFDSNTNLTKYGKGGAVYSSGVLNTESCIFKNNTASEENNIYSVSDM